MPTLRPDGVIPTEEELKQLQEAGYVIPIIPIPQEEWRKIQQGVLRAQTPVLTIVRKTSPTKLLAAPETHYVGVPEQALQPQLPAQPAGLEFILGAERIPHQPPFTHLFSRWATNEREGRRTIKTYVTESLFDFAKFVTFTDALENILLISDEQLTALFDGSIILTGVTEERPHEAARKIAGELVSELVPVIGGLFGSAIKGQKKNYVELSGTWYRTGRRLIFSVTDEKTDRFAFSFWSKITFDSLRQELSSRPDLYGQEGIEAGQFGVEWDNPLGFAMAKRHIAGTNITFVNPINIAARLGGLQDLVLTAIIYVPKNGTYAQIPMRPPAGFAIWQNHTQYLAQALSQQQPTMIEYLLAMQDLAQQRNLAKSLIEVEIS